MLRNKGIKKIEKIQKDFNSHFYFNLTLMCSIANPAIHNNMPAIINNTHFIVFESAWSKLPYIKINVANTIHVPIIKKLINYPICYKKYPSLRGGTTKPSQ